MNSTSEALLKVIAYNLEPLKGINQPYLFSGEFFVLLSSLLSSLVALLIAGGIGRKIMPLLGYKTKIEFVGLKKYRQADEYWRIAVKNIGSEVAKNVQIDVTKITDNEIERENFLPITLRWTHINKENRDIMPGQIVYLDVVELQMRRAVRAKLITNLGGEISDFEELKTGRTKITLTVYQENNVPFDKTIEISWPTEIFFDARIEGEQWHITTDGTFIHV